jgi:hypothetical protein
MTQQTGQNFENQELVEENLIPVSDDENDDEELDDDDDDDDEDDEDEDEDDDEENEEPMVIELSHDPNGGVKVINFADLLNSVEEIEENDNNSEELGDLDELDDVEDLEEENDDSEQNGSDDSELKQLNTSDLEFIKSIDISNLEESGDKNNIDYKKMSLNKLKEIAVAKGLVTENSKATKNAILKLLGSE